jgi:hypothetical protein
MTATTPAPAGDTSTDRAIIIAVGAYPRFNHLPQLRGPLHDADEFRKWLVKPAGGNLQPNQIEIIVSQVPAGTDPYPLLADVESAFDRLYAVAQKNKIDGPGFRVGRRLYLYCSGHGFDRDLGARATSLLLANADHDRPYNFVGPAYAEWFWRAAFFDEILLFMDCCRTYAPLYPQAPPHFRSIINATGMVAVRSFHAFAARWSETAHEWPIPPHHTPRGVFTTALLTGLNGEAADPAGDVTAESLGKYLYDNMRRFLPEQARQDEAVPKWPDFRTEPSGQAGQFKIVTGISPATLEVEAQPPADGLTIQLIGPDLTAVQPSQSKPPVWTFRGLKVGLYAVRAIEGDSVRRQRVIEVRMGVTHSCKI